MAFDWAWEEGTPKEERAFKIVQSSPTLFFPELNQAPFRTWAIEFASRADAPAARVLVRPVPRQAAREERADALAPGRGLLGPQPRRPRHHVLDAAARRRRDERLHALHRRRPPRRCARACQRCRACRAICSRATPDEARAVACPLRVGGVTFHHSKTPHMTTANESTEWRRILTQHLRVGRHRRRRRPLPVEGVRQPVHGRAHHPTHALRAPNGNVNDGSSRRVFLPGDYRPVPNELAKPNVDAFVARAHEGALRTLGHEPSCIDQLPHDARRRDRRAVGHRRSDDRRVRALGLRTAHHRRRRRSRRAAAARVELRRHLARPRRSAQHRRVPHEPRPRAQPAVVGRGRSHDRRVVHGRARHLGARPARSNTTPAAFARTPRARSSRRSSTRCSTGCARSGRSLRCSATRRWG